MKKMTDMKTGVPDGKSKKNRLTENDECFVLHKFSEIKEDMKILKFEPFKSFLLPAIRAKKLKDLFFPVLLPSMDKNGNVQYSKGATRTLSGKSWLWWYHQAKNYKPERKSHLADRKEYLAFIYSMLLNMKSGNAINGFSSLGSKYYMLAYDDNINGFWSAGDTSIGDNIMLSMVSLHMHHRIERARKFGVGLIVFS